MRWRKLGWLGVALAGCFTPPKCPPGAPLVAVDGGWTCGSTSSLTITDHLCDGGTTTFHVPNPSGGALDVHQRCSPTTVSVLEAHCGTRADARWPEATFTLPPDFDPSQGHMALMGNICCPQTDGGMVCELGDDDTPGRRAGNRFTTSCVRYSSRPDYSCTRFLSVFQ